MLLQELESDENSAVGEEVRICFMQSYYLLLPFRSLVLDQTSTGQLCSSGSNIMCSFRWEILVSALFLLCFGKAHAVFTQGKARRLIISS